MSNHFDEFPESRADWRRHSRRPLAKFLAIAVVVIALPLVLLALAPAMLTVLAPPLDTREDLYSVNRPLAFTFLDAEGNQVGHRGAIVGDRLSVDEMPPYLPAAFIAVEDRQFYSHSGIDVHGLLRALWVNFRAHHVVQGGSTITQQTAKIVFLNPKRTVSRKIEELFDAASLEKSLSKKQILELYLNRIYLGSGAYGVDGAAHVYFGKSARDLTLPEAAMLATLTTAPSVFSPRRDLTRAQERASRVLQEMVKTHAITREQAQEARAHPALITDRSVQDARNFFLDTAADEAMRLASVNGEPPTSDLVVHTTLETKLQDAARHSLNRILAKQGRRARAHEGAVIVMKPDGAIVALVGGRDYDESVFNRATQAKRQPGSAFKPFVYLAAVESGISPWETRSDSPVDIDGWQPTNYGNRSYGTITLADALAHSVNTITASLGQEVGIDKVIEAAQRLGIKSPLAANASLALGTSEVTPIELTTAYAAFANGGMRVYPYVVTQVQNTRGTVLYQRSTAQPERVIADHVDRDMVAMLYGVVTEGTGRSAAIPGHEAAGKTGTTQDYRDAWFVGFTPDYVTCVWVGNDNNKPMRNVTGGSIPAEIWKSVMGTAELGLSSRPLNKSEPQAPIEDNGIITAESGTASVENDTEGAAASDEESGGTQVEDDSDNAASSEAANGTSGDKSEHRRGGSWWNWLFGSEPEQGKREKSPATSSVEDAAGAQGTSPASQGHTNRDIARPAHSLGTLPANGSDEGPDTGDGAGPPPDLAQHAPREVHPRRVPPDYEHDEAPPRPPRYGPPPPPRYGPPPPPPPDEDNQGAPDDDQPE